MPWAAPPAPSSPKCAARSRCNPGILKGNDTPDYGTCVDIVTKAALKEMIVPALLPVLAVVLVAAIPALGKVVLGGVLVGTHRHRPFHGHLDDQQRRRVGQREEIHRRRPPRRQRQRSAQGRVTGDTVGDPYKDTSGPAINPMIKVVNIVAILIIPIFF